MRREGYEVLVSRPEVIYREENGKRLEPFEDLWLEIPGDALGRRHAEPGRPQGAASPTWNTWATAWI